MTEMQSRLIKFAEFTLNRMESDIHWSSETLDAIAEQAKDLELVGYDSWTNLKRIFRPGRHAFHKQVTT